MGTADTCAAIMILAMFMKETNILSEESTMVRRAGDIVSRALFFIVIMKITPSTKFIRDRSLMR